MHLSIKRKFYDLKKIKIENYACENCNKKTSLNLTIRGGFICIFLIPVLPLKKDYILTCENCQKRIYKKDLYNIEKEKLSNEFKSTAYKVPFKHFTGITILLVILGFGIFTGIQMKKQEKSFVSKPLKDDVYFVKNDLGWTTYKVSKVNGDSVYIFKNNLTVDHYSKVQAINIKNNYSEIFGFRLSEIQKMYDANNIYEVQR